MMSTVIVSIVLALVVGAAIWKMIHDKRTGKGGCSGDCSCCHGACKGGH